MSSAFASTRLARRALLLALGIPSLVLLGRPSSAAPARPNVVLILADDLGFSDLGCYGSGIETPHLDSLAKEGLRFTQFYNTARCWPTRGALLTGYYAQEIRRDTVPGVRSGGGGRRPDWAPLLPRMLRELGYRSYHSGKWHVDGKPVAEGFDHSYSLDDHGRYFHPRLHFEDDKKLPPVESDSGYYSTVEIASRAIRMLEVHAETYSDTPFFLYLAFTAPHFPLQALPEDIARYRGKYDRGWEKVRAARWQRIRELGLIDGELSEPERDLGPPYYFPEAYKVLGDGEVSRPVPWNELTEAQREFQATKMTIHAAMIDRLDREVGRVLDTLRRIGAFENTLILFLSDNGASAEIMVRDDGHDPSASPGSAATHLCLGPGWSTVANTPFRRHKTWVHEGGISTPLIAHWPAGITSRGELRRSPGHVVDIVPTVLELAGAPDPTRGVDDHAPERRGKSLVPVFREDVRSRHETLWWCHEGNRALRAGSFKLVAAKGDPWELYDLSRDRTETRDLAAAEPERVHELAARWTAIWDEVGARARGVSDPPETPEPTKESGSNPRPKRAEDSTGAEEPVRSER